VQLYALASLMGDYEGARLLHFFCMAGLVLFVVVHVAMVILVLLGWVTPQQFKEGRGYAIVGIFVLAAVLTPPDVVSQLMLAIPMCLLYELGIHAARWLVPSSAVKKPAA